MASYVDQALIAGESLVHRGHLSLWVLWPQLLLGTVLLVIGIGLLFYLWAYIHYKTTELAITNKRIIAKFGFIRRDTIEINLSKVESLRVEQGIFGRILDYGTIIVSGTGSHNAPIPGVSDPMTFRKKFVEATDLMQAR
ncbi:MAG: PH domain-containing protein [Nevskiales bacterium]